VLARAGSIAGLVNNLSARAFGERLLGKDRNRAAARPASLAAGQDSGGEVVPRATPGTRPATSVVDIP
jgi:hypothetical protein